MDSTEILNAVAYGNSQQLSGWNQFQQQQSYQQAELQQVMNPAAMMPGTPQAVPGGGMTFQNPGLMGSAMGGMGMGPMSQSFFTPQAMGFGAPGMRGAGMMASQQQFGQSMGMAPLSAAQHIGVPLAGLAAFSWMPRNPLVNPFAPFMGGAAGTATAYPAATRMMGRMALPGFAHGAGFGANFGAGGSVYQGLGRSMTARAFGGAGRIAGGTLGVLGGRSGMAAGARWGGMAARGIGMGVRGALGITGVGAVALAGFEAAAAPVSAMYRGGREWSQFQEQMGEFGSVLAPYGGTGAGGRGFSRGDISAAQGMIRGMSEAGGYFPGGNTSENMQQIMGLGAQLVGQGTISQAGSATQFASELRTKLRELKEISRITRQTLEEAAATYQDLRTTGFTSSDQQIQQVIRERGMGGRTGLGAGEVGAIRTAGSAVGRKMWGTDIGARAGAAGYTRAFDAIDIATRGGIVSQEQVMGLGGSQNVASETLAMTQQIISTMNDKQLGQVYGRVFGGGPLTGPNASSQMQQLLMARPFQTVGAFGAGYEGGLTGRGATRALGMHVDPVYAQLIENIHGNAAGIQGTIMAGNRQEMMLMAQQEALGSQRSGLRNLLGQTGRQFTQPFAGVGGALGARGAAITRGWGDFWEGAFGGPVRGGGRQYGGLTTGHLNRVQDALDEGRTVTGAVGGTGHIRETWARGLGMGVANLSNVLSNNLSAKGALGAYESGGNLSLYPDYWSQDQVERHVAQGGTDPVRIGKRGGFIRDVGKAAESLANLSGRRQTQGEAFAGRLFGGNISAREAIFAGQTDSEFVRSATGLFNVNDKNAAREVLSQTADRLERTGGASKEATAIRQYLAADSDKERAAILSDPTSPIQGILGFMRQEGGAKVREILLDGGLTVPSLVADIEQGDIKSGLLNRAAAEQQRLQGQIDSRREGLMYGSRSNLGTFLIGESLLPRAWEGQQGQDKALSKALGNLIGNKDAQDIVEQYIDIKNKMASSTDPAERASLGEQSDLLARQLQKQILPGAGAKGRDTVQQWLHKNVTPTVVKGAIDETAFGTYLQAVGDRSRVARSLKGTTGISGVDTALNTLSSDLMASRRLGGTEGVEQSRGDTKEFLKHLVQNADIGKKGPLTDAEFALAAQMGFPLETMEFLQTGSKESAKALGLAENVDWTKEKDRYMDLEAKHLFGASGMPGGGSLNTPGEAFSSFVQQVTLLTDAVSQLRSEMGGS